MTNDTITRGIDLDLLTDTETAWSYFLDLVEACRTGYRPTLDPTRWQHRDLADALARFGCAVWWKG